MVPATGLIGILAGPTATGKSALALALAEEAAAAGAPIELVNADSLLFYRGMDIGTAKPSAAERERVPHHLIDIRDPGEGHSAGDFVREATSAIVSIEGRGHRPLLVGGTGFYLKALIRGPWRAPPADPELRAELGSLENAELLKRLQRVDPLSAQRIGPNDRYRLIRALEIWELTGRSPSELAKEIAPADPRFRLWVIDRPETELESRIRVRTRHMLESGLVGEARELFGRFPGVRPLRSVGYAQALDFLNGVGPRGRKRSPGLAGLADEIDLATRHLAKSQRTWFKGQHPEARHFLLDAELEKLRAEFRSVYLEAI
jgi:tRNA dimethylallyltransferase